MGGVVEGFDTTLIRENGSRAALKERSLSFWKKLFCTYSSMVFGAKDGSIAFADRVLELHT